MSRRPTSRPAASVVIPAYNATSTLAVTLTSIQRQTVSDLEIIVVDDGSKDETAQLANAFAKRDRRIHVISTANEGVAAARNVGIQAARSDIIAPVDADDLWHPLKMERQLAALADPDVAMTYVGQRSIDADDGVIESERRSVIEGWACHQLTVFNAVGSGSAMAFRRQDALSVGGYDSRLRAMGAEGCEDFLLQIQLACIGKVVADPQYLVGYRRLPSGMSRNNRRMLKSRVYALKIVAREHPFLAETADMAARHLKFFLALKEAQAGSARGAFSYLADWADGADRYAPVRAYGFLRHRWRNRSRQRTQTEIASRKPFMEYDPEEDIQISIPDFVRPLLRIAREADEAYGRLQAENSAQCDAGAGHLAKPASGADRPGAQ